MANLNPHFATPAELSAASTFIDRESESEALASGLARHREWTATEFDASRLNVMSFYGISGVGKTFLSKRLEAWLAGKLSQTDRWGPRPTNSQIAVRWELNDAQGNIDIVPLLVGLRSELHKIKRSWPAFDLAFLAYLSSMRPGENNPLARIKRVDFDGGLGEIVADLLETFDMEPVLAGFSGPLVRKIFRAARKRVDQWAATRVNSAALLLVERALSEPGPENPLPDLAAEILWQLTLEINQMAPEDRPQITILIDHFERVQNTATGAGERTINEFVFRLPFCFFVITGQNIVEWYKADRLNIKRAGPHHWPGLVPGVSDGPRQHRLGHLSESDTRALLYRRRDQESLNVSDDTLEALVKITDGWPVHIDAVAFLARRRKETDPRRETTLADLEGSLEEVVHKMLVQLPPDERRAFLAACILPSFDVELAHAVAGGIDEGAVVRFTGRSIVTENIGSQYPFRVHEQIRAAVRAAGAKFEGGWSPADWQKAAARAFEFAKERVEAGRVSNDDRGVQEGIALTIHLALDFEVDAPWIDIAVRDAPSMVGLRPLIPSSDRFTRGSQVGGIVELIEILDENTSASTLDRLSALLDRGLLSSPRAGLWRAYRLRNFYCDYNAALRQLDLLLEMYPAKERLYLRQRSITLAMARRFQQSIDSFSVLSEDVAAGVQETIDRALGRLDDSIETLARRVVANKDNRRFQLELTGTLALTRARLGEISREELVSLLELATSIGHRSLERDVLNALGYIHLLHPDEFGAILSRLELIGNTGKVHAIAELTALHALASGDNSGLRPPLAVARGEQYKSSTWIATETYFEALGQPLERQQTEWIEDESVVRQRWMAIGKGIIDRARAAG